MFDQELGMKVELVIQKLEDRANQPPRISWDREVLRSGGVGYPIFGAGLIDAIQRSNVLDMNCNNFQSVAVGLSGL